jgi:hypothetical protein
VRKRRAGEDAAGEGGGGAGGAAPKKSAHARGSANVAGKDVAGNACLAADNRNLAQGNPIWAATSYVYHAWNEFRGICKFCQ